MKEQNGVAKHNHHYKKQIARTDCIQAAGWCIRCSYWMLERLENSVNQSLKEIDIFL